MKIDGATATDARKSAPAKRKPCHHAVEIGRGGRPGPDAGDVAVVFAQVVGLVHRVELHRRVEEREDEDQDRLGEQVLPAGRAEVQRQPVVPVRLEASDGLRQGEDRRGEDDRDHAGHDHAERHVGRAAARLAVAELSPRVLHRDPPLSLHHEHDRHDDAEGDEREEQPSCRGAVDPAADPARRIGEDRGEDQDRDAVADAALRDLLAHPHEQRRARGEREDDDEQPAGVRARQGALVLEEERVAGRLRGGERDGEVARVLRDLGVAGLALLLEPLELRHDDRQELQDDRRRDVRHDPEREEREAGQRRAGEEVEQAEDAAPPAPLKNCLTAAWSTPGAGSQEPRR